MVEPRFESDRKVALKIGQVIGLNLSGLLDSLYSFGHKLSYRPQNEVILNVLES